MIVIAHRGFWLRPKEQNSITAFVRALDYAFGIELDVRDCNNRIVISHDMPNEESKEFKSVFKSLYKHNNFKKITYAINIKSEGIEQAIVNLIIDFDIAKNSFVFDMSIPSMYIFYKQYKRCINFATRHSDIEQSPVLYRKAKWIWIDELEKSWISNKIILYHLQHKKNVCIVSPELHRRPHLRLWQHYRLLPKFLSERISICTDLPQVAEEFFNLTNGK